MRELCAQVQCNLLFLLSFSLHVMQVERFVVTMKLASLLCSQSRYYQTASLLFVIDFGSLVFVSYRYVEITITNGVIVVTPAVPPRRTVD